MIEMIAHGWAIVANGEINVATVSPTRRGALVNWLVVSARVPVFNDHSDAQIESMWDERRFDACARVTDVQIEELP